MKGNGEPQKFKDIIKNKKTVKPPAYPWQDLALRIIDELNIPAKKRNPVFRVCKQHPKAVIEKALNDTKELAEGERWKYFFKVVSQEETRIKPASTPSKTRRAR